MFVKQLGYLHPTPFLHVPVAVHCASAATYIHLPRSTRWLWNHISSSSPGFMGIEGSGCMGLHAKKKHVYIQLRWVYSNHPDQRVRELGTESHNSCDILPGRAWVVRLKMKAGSNVKVYHVSKHLLSIFRPYILFICGSWLVQWKNCWMHTCVDVYFFWTILASVSQVPWISCSRSCMRSRTITTRVVNSAYIGIVWGVVWSLYP